MLVRSVAHNRARWLLTTQYGSNTPKFMLKRIKAHKLIQIWESYFQKQKTAQGLTLRGLTIECLKLSKLVVNHGQYSRPRTQILFF